jgi:hypothetical protein
MEKDQVIFNEGDHGEYFYIILEGEVEILKSSKVPIMFDPEKKLHGEELKIEKRKAYFLTF